MEKNTEFKIKNSKLKKTTIPTSAPFVKGGTGETNSKLQTLNSPVAFLWNESFLWGLMAYKALKRLGLPFELVRADDITSGILRNYKMLFVPGGWASNKGTALGETGLEAIRDFVRRGGNYLGFCGGAGLATQAKGGLGLLGIKRRPTKDRVPSFSGKIGLRLNEHPIWNGVLESGVRSQESGEKKERSHSTLLTHNSELIFHAWWPSQFIVEDGDVNVLATYGDAMPDAFSSDLNVGDVERAGNWDELERVYGINLNPGRLRGEPAVVAGRFGKGRVVLSLVHFDTPGDGNGEHVLINLWEYLGAGRAEERKRGSVEETAELPNCPASSLFDLCSELIALGERNFLWFWRNEMLLQWRRGVRGLEYNTLYVIMHEIERQRSAVSGQWSGEVEEKIMPLIKEFIEKASRLLILERHELQKGNHITYEKCDVAGIRKLREELFSSSKSHGGMFKQLIDQVDAILYILLKSIQ